MNIAYALPICPSCGANRIELKNMLNSPNVLQTYFDGYDKITKSYWGKSDEQLIAETIISRCDLCKAFFYGDK